MLAPVAFAQSRASAIFSEKQAMEVLGLEEEASPEEIRSAYRRLAKALHPDSNRGDPKAGEKFNQLQEAHDVLTGKLAPGIQQGGGGSSAGGAGNRNGFRGFQDFGGEDFTDGFRHYTHTSSGPREKTEEKPASAFVRRFFLQNDFDITPELEKTLGEYVALSEKLFAKGMIGDVIKMQNAVEEATGHPKLARKIFFTMMGEHVQRYQYKKQADQAVKAYFASKTGQGLENALEDLMINRGNIRLMGEKGAFAEVFPETARYILGHPELPGVRHSVKRVVFLIFAREADKPAHTRFYAEIARGNPLLRAQLLQAKIKELLRPHRQPGEKLSGYDIRRRSEEILREMSGAGREMDAARMSLYQHLLHSDFNPQDYPGFLQEIRKIQDFSSFELPKGLDTSYTKGKPEGFAARKAMLLEMLTTLKEKAPEKLAEQIQELREFILPEVRHLWAGVTDIVYPFQEQAAPTTPRTAEERLHAEQCAKEYAKVSKIIGGTP